MSLITPNFNDTVIVRSANAEVIGRAPMFFITLGKRIPARRAIADQDAATAAPATEPPAGA